MTSCSFGRNPWSESPSSDLATEPEALLGPVAGPEPGRVVAALFDGLPLAGHNFLAGRLEIDDPDDFSSKYGLAAEQRHGTAMASLILHGDLNDRSLRSNTGCTHDQ